VISKNLPVMSSCAKGGSEGVLRRKAGASTITVFSLLGLVPAQAFRASRSEAAPTDPINGKPKLIAQFRSLGIRYVSGIGVRFSVCPAAGAGAQTGEELCLFHSSHNSARHEDLADTRNLVRSFDSLRGL
jgi:hypothetical protein